MAKIKMKIPKRFIRVESAGKTRAKRGKGGKFTGRETVRGQGDTTHARRVIRNVDVDGDKKTDFFGGTILGRTTKVKASSRAKGYQRRI